VEHHKGFGDFAPMVVDGIQVLGRSNLLSTVAETI
jgi:hypothetical protein